MRDSDSTLGLDPDVTMTARPAQTRDDGELSCTVLVAVGPDGRHQRLEVGPTPISVGRIVGNDMVLPAAEVSRNHCRVALHWRGLEVVDLGSTNGTWHDGRRIAAPALLRPGESVRVGAWTLRCERGTAREMQRAEEVARELDRAGRYVQALLPPPILEGPVRADWRFLPCASIGGDAFGYRYLDDRHFALFIMDVAGHGAGSALLAASVMNLLRERASGPLAPGQSSPAAVLGTLNDSFQMDQQGGLFFSAWYGLYDLSTRRLGFAAAGHHPGFLCRAGSQPQPLVTRNPAIGMMPDLRFLADEVAVPPSSRLVLFSDGAFETIGHDGRQRGLADLLAILVEPPAVKGAELDRLLSAARAGARPGPFDDDVCILDIEFD
jgi:hypothetical protein